MTCSVTLDWKSFAALGLTATVLALVAKDPNAAKEVLASIADATKEGISNLNHKITD